MKLSMDNRTHEARKDFSKMEANRKHGQERQSLSRQNQEALTKFSLTGIFLGLFLLFVSHKQVRTGRPKQFQLRPADIALLGLTTMRLGRQTAYDKVFEPFRKPFTKTVEDPTGAGMTVEPDGTGSQKVLGELLSCPICSGTWIASFLVYGLHLFPGPTRIFLTIMGSVGLAEILNGLVETLTWTGQATRTYSGKIFRKRERGIRPFKVTGVKQDY